jgi:hypothetical protein
MHRRAVLAFLLAADLAPPAFAHSLKELEDQLVGKEKDFQPVDVPAPGFTLIDADGRTIRLADFRPKAHGLEFTKDVEVMLAPGVVTHVIDQQGRMRVRFHGLEFDPLNFVNFVSALTSQSQDQGHKAE